MPKPEQYLNLFPKLEKLQVLDLQNSNVDDNGLKIIGTWCKNLRVLNVNECCKLTDNGVEGLVLQSPELSKTLQELLITCPAITKKGIILTVQHFPALQVVENSYAFEALVEVVRSASLDQDAPKVVNISFGRLFVHSVRTYKRGNFELAIKHCPLLFDITVFVKRRLRDTDMFCLTNLKNLKILKFYADPTSKDDEITFDKGIAPVLKVIGSSLKVLDFSYFEFDDIWTIARFCPNLISLTFVKQCQSLSVLNENEIIQLRSENDRVMFQELKVLKCGYNLSSDILFDLFSCPSLEEVNVTLCDALTDEFLEEAILSFNIFKNLKVLMLVSCHFVTKQGLNGLVINENNLQQMILLFCDKLTKANAYDWHTFSRRKNGKLRLFFEDNDTKHTYE